MQHAVVVPGMHWNPMLPQVLKKNRHWSVSRERHLPFFCCVTHYLWKQQTCKPVMQNMGLGPTVEYVALETLACMPTGLRATTP